MQVVLQRCDLRLESSDLVLVGEVRVVDDLLQTRDLLAPHVDHVLVLLNALVELGLGV